MDSIETLVARLQERLGAHEEVHAALNSAIRELKVEIRDLRDVVNGFRLTAAGSGEGPPSRKFPVVQIVLPAAGLVGLGMLISEAVQKLIGK